MQKTHALFLNETWGNLNYFLKTMSSFKEGDRSLLDSMLVLIHSDCEMARTHTINGIPIMLAGKAGGKIKSGISRGGRQPAGQPDRLHRHACLRRGPRHLGRQVPCRRAIRSGKSWPRGLVPACGNSA